MRKPKFMTHVNQLAVRAAKVLIKTYQFLISPLLGSRCRFYPSCSNYCIQAMEIHGFIKGGYLSLKRLLKCHPWHPGGIDHVPSASQKSGCSHGCMSDNTNQQHSGKTT